jgi:uncharacterized protein (TIGR02217 family)
MTRFIDEYLPDCIPGYPCTSTPVWGNVISRSSSGAENARQIWENPMHHFSLPVAARKQDILEGLKNFWMIMRGTLHTFPFRDPLDFASVALDKPNTEPVVSMLDQEIGVGDGANRFFQLTKTYTVGSNTYVRPIALPIVSTLLVSVDGSLKTITTDYTVSRPDGLITFTIAPAAGKIIKAGFLFDVEVRFESNDTYAGVVRASNVAGFENLNLMEVRHC